VRGKAEVGFAAVGSGGINVNQYIRVNLRHRPTREFDFANHEIDPPASVAALRLLQHYITTARHGIEIERQQGNSDG